MAKVTEAMRKGFLVNVKGEEIRAHRIDSDVNGNPRYVVHFLALGIDDKDYGKIKGLPKYRAKWFGGGCVIESFNIKQDLEWALEQVEKYYSK